MSLTVDDKIAIHELLARVGFALDDRDADALVALFTPDGVFALPEGDYPGDEGLRRLVSQTPAPRRQHWFGSLLLDGEGDRATGRANGIVVEDADGRLAVVSLARQEHSFRRVDGNWLVERTVRIRPTRDPD